jgi:hypothetical protein
MTKKFKRGAIAAASATAILSLAIATPSFAHGNKGPRGAQNSVPAVSGQVERPAKEAHTHASVSASITAIPETVTNVGKIVRGAQFVAYTLAADATAIPSTQPTTGGTPVKVVAKVGAGNVVSYSVEIDAPVTAGTVKYAVYNAAGVGVLVTVVTDSSGVATATSSAALTTAYAEPTKPTLAEGKGVKKGNRR